MPAAEAAERALKGVGEFAFRRPAGLGRHDLPEHRMIDVPAGVVAHRGPNILRRGCAVVHEQLFHALRSERRMAFQRLIEVRHIGVVMLAVVNLHRRFINGRFKRVCRIRQRRK